MNLASERLAPACGGPPSSRLVFVHGFTQTRSSWSAIAAELARSHGDEAILVDAPGHGRSAALRLDLRAGAAALGRTGGRATYVGYSMGGRLALHLALAEPDIVQRLVLVSATAGLDDAATRDARRADDERLAARIERDGVAAFLDDWLALPLFANLPPDGTQLADRLGNTAAGLASSLRLAGTGAQQPLWPLLPSLPMPVLLIAGALDAKFVAIAEAMGSSIPTATVAIVPGAGHTVHLEKPEAFLATLRAWLDATPAPSDPSIGAAPV